MGNSHQNHLVWNQQLNQNQTLMEQSVDDPLPKLCPAIALFHQDGRHSGVALLLKAALIQVSDYRLMGQSGQKIEEDIVSKMARSILGHFHQGSHIFQPCNGMQCTAVALLALLTFMKCANNTSFESRDLDEILV